MGKKPLFSIVLSFRNREETRVRRCLRSLSHQHFTDFEVLLVDYGSDTAVASAIHSLVREFPFATYIYSDTRGQPWNRSRALNIGIQLASGQYILTTDVDLIFAPDFLTICQQEARPKRILHILPFLLPQGFDDWDNVINYAGRFPKGSTSMLGACQLAAAEAWRQCQGFDEFYRYYGAEDHDLEGRFALLGIEPFWLTEFTTVFHQWHPAVNYLTAGFMSGHVWTRIRLYIHQNHGILLRNDEIWGRVITTDERRISQFLDLESNTIIPQPKLHRFSMMPYSPQSVALMMRAFFELPPGDALAVEDARFPQRFPWLDWFIRIENSILRRLGVATRLDYSINLLHDSLIYLIEQAPEAVADYYLDAGGVAVIVRA